MNGPSSAGVKDGCKDMMNKPMLKSIIATVLVSIGFSADENS